MGKKQHQKDKMYLTFTEWTNLYGGKKSGPVVGERAAFRRLPFDHCALSLQPFEHPLCNGEGIIYDLMSIVPFLKKYGIDPASGKRLDAKDLLRLNFAKNSEGKYHCPVLFKVFNENSHIVAIRTTGNVFSYEAVEELNIKPKNFKDLLTDESFLRKDIITIQDPSDVEKRNLSDFHHLKKNLKVVEDDGESSKSTHNLKSITPVTKDILEELEKEYKNKSEEKATSKSTADKFNAAHYSTGAVAASSTSTAIDVSTEHEAAILDDDTVRYSRIKKKGYVQIVTNLGMLNIELYCDKIPKACENFIKLSKSGYYNGTVFHRSIRNFMIQGGDPTGKGTGGESAWGKPFNDEFRPNLSHQGRGILSMANSGPNTNKSQFFITYRSCTHLDKKHTIFGKVVGGLSTLNDMERIETDSEDRPIEDIKIVKVAVFVDPFQEVDDELQGAREEEKKKAEREKVEKLQTTTSQPSLKIYHSGVGKYINPEKRNANEDNDPSFIEKKKKKVITGDFGDFSSW